ncbi:unnamed protein product [Rhizoctonia solani]|uniref:F-box domain-containing protein n=1 Tax=Rhizoctonia solani TaxID=456999 RepID=A0A8H3GDJ6_9AGAM|nr:unnamed protein product [Rhizoctonia solani]
MLDTVDPLATPAVRHWEKAGTLLANALGLYVDHCASLGKSSLKEGIPPKELASRIDSTLDSLHTLLDQQIAQARSILSKTRNEILSPATRLPEEVLAEIFTYVVFSDRTLESSTVATIEDSVIGIYRSLHSLIGVCSVWRNAALVRGEFWSITPVLEYPFPAPQLKKAVELSLGRAGSRELHLAGVLSTHRSLNIDILEKHTSRFRTVNIISESYDAIRRMIGVFLASSTPVLLSELSICQKQATSFYRGLPSEYQDLYPVHPDTDDPIFEFYGLLGSLSILRLSGAHIRLDRLPSDQLTKLRLQSLNLGYDHEMIFALRCTLSSATRLRDLGFVSIRTFPNSGWPLEDSYIATQTITIPSLQTLLIQDLYFNTMTYLLASITSRSHHMTLYITENYRQYNDAEDGYSGSPDMTTLHRILKRTPVHTLCIDHTRWMLSSDIRDLLKSMPLLNTLRLDHRELYEQDCNTIQRPGSRKSQRSFPHLVNLHLSRIEIWDKKAFKKMVASYSSSLKGVVLGAVV